MYRREFMRFVGSSLLATTAFSSPLTAQPYTSLFSPARNLGDSVAGLFGIGHPDQEINEAYFEQILGNQERIISALGSIASSIQSAAGILKLIPYQTNEIDEAIRANKLFIKSQGLLTAIADAMANGVDPQDQAFVDAFANLVEDTDDSTASYLSAITSLGQSHDLCVSVRPLWNAVQSVRDAGRVTVALSPGHSALLKEAARRISDTCSRILEGSAAPAAPFGLFKSRYDEQLTSLNQAAQILTSYRAREIVDIDYFKFSPSGGFYLGSGESVMNGSVHRTNTGPVLDCDFTMTPVLTDPEFCQVIEGIIGRHEAPATMTRTRLSSSLDSERLFSLTLTPQRNGTVINTHIENLNTQAAQFYHYFAVEAVLKEVVSEIETAIGDW